MIIESIQYSEEARVRQFNTTLTKRGQVTLPAAIRRMLGVKPREKVTFEIDGNDIRIVPSKFTIESVRGSVPALPTPKSLQQIFDQAGEEHARHVCEESATSADS
jgi:AbrB family looped-hinge helix DNA binding protein